MPVILIFGGSGKVALHLTRILTASTPPHTVYSIIRSESHSSAIKAAGGTPILHNIEESSSSKMAAMIRSFGTIDAIVWAAGAGGKGGEERTDAVDRKGAIDAMDAAKETGVFRYVVVSAVDVRDRSKGIPEWYAESMKERSGMVWKAIGRYMEAKLAADRELVGGNETRGLRYTIVRPSGLLDVEGTGKVEAGKTSTFNSISRQDVAAVVAECLKNNETVGLAFDVVGGQTPIDEAVKQVAEKKINTFERFY